MTREAVLIRPEGPVPYGPANEAMHRLAERRLAGEIPDTVILLEHPPVFTAGRRARPEELLWSPDELAARGAEVYRIDRGGAFTFHGPGQLVGYPILDLRPDRCDVHRYVRDLEDVMIRAAASFGVSAERSAGLTGVWVDNEKLAAIGVRIARWITSHGFAFNVNTNLAHFELIVPCGLADKRVTSLAKLLGRTVEVAEVQTALVDGFLAVFDRNQL